MHVESITPPLNSAAEPVGVAWPVQGAWRYEDLRQLPADGRRYELTNGTLYALAAPSYEHQVTLREIFFHLQRYVDRYQWGVAAGAPCAVYLPATGDLVQPDVVVWRDGCPAFGGRVYTGVPALIVEVMAANSKRHDSQTKFDCYEAAGVAEYWLADLVHRAVEVFTLARGEYALAGRYTGDEAVKSVLLSGLAVRSKLLFNL